jgi:hypothetical protein
MATFKGKPARTTQVKRMVGGEVIPMKFSPLGSVKARKSGGARGWLAGPKGPKGGKP